MAIKKTTKSVRPGQGQPGGPPNPTKLQISSGVTVLGQKPFGVNSPILQRKPLTNAQMKELKAMIAKAEAQKASVAKDAKKNARIVKKQNKQAASNSKPVKKAATQKSRPVVKVTPRRGGALGGTLGGGGMRGPVIR